MAGFYKLEKVVANGGGSTALFDAVVMTVEQLKHRQCFRSVVVIYSDGQDNSSKHNYKEMRQALERLGVMVYVVLAQAPPRLGIVSTSNINWSGVLDLALISGGRMLSPQWNQRTDAFELIALELRHQYSVTFK